MFVRVLTVLLFAKLLACPLTAFAAEPKVSEGRVTAVTVYQGQALVTREVEIPETEGLLELVVTNLPESVLPGSLFAEPGEGIQIRSVRYRARPIEADVRQEVRELDEQIQAVDQELFAIAQERGLMVERKQYLMQLGHFAAATSQQELKSGVLNADTLMKLTQFQFSERAEISGRELELNQEERERNEEKHFLVRKRETIAAGSARTVREAVVFINVPQRTTSQMQLSYLVGNANWSPSYNLRSTEERDQITVEYNASIEQMSGEDWNDVEMILSTATPSLVAKAPRLEELAIKLGVPEPAQQQPMSAAANYKLMQENLVQLGKMRGQINASPSDRFGGSSEASQTAVSGLGGAAGGIGSWGLEMSDTSTADARLNQFACEIQLLDLNNSLSDLKRDGEISSRLDEGVSVSYQLTNRTSLPSRSDRQLIQIASVPLNGDFYRLATPLLTSFVYEEAHLTNTSDLVFLAGPVATFLGGQFVGRSEMPTVAVGESLTVGLGIDPSLRAHRELLKKDERIQGGNRVVDFTYELTLENFGDKSVAVRLLDRLPTVGENDIKITLIKTDDPVSTDESYLKSDRKEGILRWDLEVPAQAVGPKEKVLKYTMQIEYDKQLSIVGMPAKK